MVSMHVVRNKVKMATVLYSAEEIAKCASYIEQPRFGILRSESEPGLLYILIVPSWANFIAVDKNGQIVIHKFKPKTQITDTELETSEITNFDKDWCTAVTRMSVAVNVISDNGDYELSCDGKFQRTAMIAVPRDWTATIHMTSAKMPVLAKNQKIKVFVSTNSQEYIPTRQPKTRKKISADSLSGEPGAKKKSKIKA